ncbi:MAG TPA: tetratricopeptide repeat protein [Stellaceae bacterium]|jgi:Flp pilus assembly protein TadD
MGRTRISGRLGRSIHFIPGCAAVALAVAALAGCRPFPVHLDPVSVNGRDGGGPAPSYDALMRIGTAARAGGDLTNALAIFRRAAAIQPTVPAPFVAVGDTLLAMGQVNDAIAAYNSALARDSGDFAAQLGLGRAYLESGRPELALVPVSKVLAARPNDAKALLLLGVAKDQAGDHPAAQEAYRRGLGYAPGDPALSVDLALSLALSGNYPNAIAVLQPVAMAPRGTAQERQTLALIYGLQGSLAEAAQLGRIDLDEASVEHNLAYYQTLRGLSPEARSRAVLSAGRTPAPGGLS